MIFEEYLIKIIVDNVIYEVWEIIYD